MDPEEGPGLSMSERWQISQDAFMLDMVRSAYLLVLEPRHQENPQPSFLSRADSRVSCLLDQGRLILDDLVALVLGCMEELHQAVPLAGHLVSV